MCFLFNFNVYFDIKDFYKSSSVNCEDLLRFLTLNIYVFTSGFTSRIHICFNVYKFKNEKGYLCSKKFKIISLAE